MSGSVVPSDNGQSSSCFLKRTNRSQIVLLGMQGRHPISTQGKRPVALFVDEAHDLNGNTLTGLKRLMEVVENSGGRLSEEIA